MTSTMMLGAPIHAINDTEAPVLCSRADPIYLYILSIVVFSSRDYTGGLTVAMYELQSQAPSTPSCEKKDGLEDAPADRKSTRLNSSHSGESRMPSSA